MTLEFVDPLRAIADGRSRPSGLAVNLRVGEELVLTMDGQEPIVIRFEAKHGNGGRLRVRAVPAVKIKTPAAQPEKSV